MTEPSTRRKPLIQKNIDLTRLAREGEAIVVRNTLSTISVLVLRIEGNEEISEFAARDDHDGNDIMELPSTYLKSAQFRKQILRGIYEIIEADDPDVLEAVTAQKASWEAQQAMKVENDIHISQQLPRAFSGIQCIAQEGRVTCSEYAISSQANNRERPPLCSKHAYLAGQYVSEETGKFVDTKPEIHWAKIEVNKN